MDLHGGGRKKVSASTGEQPTATEAMIRFQATFRLSLAPPFTEPQIAYLEDLLANKLMGIVAHSRCGHECAACFGVIDGVLALVRNLRQQRSQ